MSAGSKRLESKNLDRQRIDKWLWHARMVRTRGDAAALATAGFVRLNGKRITAAGHPVPGGDGRIGPRELTLQVMRETACPGPDAQFHNCIENGGVYPGGPMAPRDGVSFDV